MSGKKGSGDPSGQAPVDEETKARLKAEKAARKALFEQTRGAEIAAQKANKSKGKQKNKGENIGPDPCPGKSPADKKTPDAILAAMQQTAASCLNSKTMVTLKAKEELKGKQCQCNTSASTPTATQSPGSKAGDQVTSGATKIRTTFDTVEAWVAATLISDEVKQRSQLKPTKTSSAQKSTKEVRASRVQSLFDHLPKGIEPSKLLEDVKVLADGLHPKFIALGLQYAQGQIQGSNKRVIALLDAVENFIDTFVTKEGSEFKYEISAAFKKNLIFLRKCRPFAVAMNNTVEFIHSKFRDLEIVEGRSEREIKDEIISSLQEFKDEKITKAVDAIRESAKSKIVKNDVVLIFGYSDLVTQIISEASKSESFSIVIVDVRAYATERRSKGLDIINQLEIHPCGPTGVQFIKYTSITGLSNVIRGVTKVVLSAHALLTNGGVLAHAGTSEIALIANTNNIPVIVCCETLKFCDKCPTDSFFLNELGTGFGLRKKNQETLPQDIEHYLVTPVIKYDVTPAELVTAVITDVDILPSTSVPAVLRVQENKPMRC